MEKIVTSDDFISMLDAGINEDIESNIDFNDEIISIESVGNRKTYDINVEGDDHFFYANNILTHNSATGANLDIQTVDNDSVSDSLGSIMTADFIMFLLQTPAMKEEGRMTCKVTKNRFTGRTDFWDMKIDYEHMRFSDDKIGNDMNNIEKLPATMTETQINDKINDINTQDIKIIKRHDSKLEPEFDVLTELGLN